MRIKKNEVNYFKLIETNNKNNDISKFRQTDFDVILEDGHRIYVGKDERGAHNKFWIYPDDEEPYLCKFTENQYSPAGELILSRVLDKLNFSHAVYLPAMFDLDGEIGYGTMSPDVLTGRTANSSNIYREISGRSLAEKYLNELYDNNYGIIEHLNTASINYLYEDLTNHLVKINTVDREELTNYKEYNLSALKVNGPPIPGRLMLNNYEQKIKLNKNEEQHYNALAKSSKKDLATFRSKVEAQLKNRKFSHYEHTVDFYLDAIKCTENYSDENLKNLRTDLLKVALIQGIFLMNDLHEENISFLKDKNSGEIKVMPLYDYGSCLQLDWNYNTLKNKLTRLQSTTSRDNPNKAFNAILNDTKNCAMFGVHTPLLQASIQQRLDDGSEITILKDSIKVLYEELAMEMLSNVELAEFYKAIKENTKFDEIRDYYKDCSNPLNKKNFIPNEYFNMAEKTFTLTTQLMDREIRKAEKQNDFYRQFLDFGLER